MPLRRALAVTLASMTLVAACRRSTLPEALSDAAFWQLSEQLAEPAGTFALSDNYVSNERRFAESVRWLQVSGGVYTSTMPDLQAIRAVVATRRFPAASPGDERP